MSSAGNNDVGCTDAGECITAGKSVHATQLPTDWETREKKFTEDEDDKMNLPQARYTSKSNKKNICPDAALSLETSMGKLTTPNCLQDEQAKQIEHESGLV